MKSTANYFLQSIKDGNASNFVDAIENMTPEQVESLTNCWLPDIENHLPLTLSEWSEKEVFDFSITQWAFENLRYDHNTVKNQEIKGKLVDREVHVCQSSLVSRLREENLEGFEITNEAYYDVDLSTGNEEFSEDEKEEKLEELREKLEQLEGEFDEDWDNVRQMQYEEDKQRIEDDIEALEDAEPEYREIYEYWVVSSWLEGKLEEHGECIVEHVETGATWWGRCASGQAILLDWVISQIAFEMGILEFQEYAWK